jgi:protein O-mannosyl-transferase
VVCLSRCHRRGYDDEIATGRILATSGIGCNRRTAVLGGERFEMTRRKKNTLPDEAPAKAVTTWTPSMSKWTWAGVCVLVVLTTAIYLPAIGGGELLDDDLLLTRNPIVQSPSGLYQFWFTDKPSDYWPVTNSTFWIEWQFWGDRLTGYHLTNLALHVVESLLIWFLLKKLEIPGAFWGALLFAVHPVNVESVAWIASRKNLVAMLFLLLSLWFYLNAEMRLSTDNRGRRKANGAKPADVWASATAFSRDEFTGVWYWLSFAAFVLAMLGKGSAVVMPALLLCILWWKRPLQWRDLRRMLPFAVAGVALAGVNLWFQTHDTAEKSIRNVDLVDRVLGAGGIVWFYLYKAIWPFDLALIYPNWHIDARNWIWWLPLCGAALATALLLAATKPWRPARNRIAPFWFAWLFFAAALLPVMGLCDVGFMKYTLVADRYLHVALLAIVALAAAAIGTARAKLPKNLRWAAIAPAIVVVAVFSFFSWRQSGLYVDRFTLFQAAKEKNPDCWMIYHTLGTCELANHRPKESIEYLLNALRLHPHEDPDSGQIHETYARALFQLGRTREGVEELEAAFAAGRRPPVLIDKLRNSYKQTKDQDKLLAFDAELTDLFPGNPAYHNNYGLTLIQAGQAPAAIQQFQRAIELDHMNAEAFNNLGAVYYRLGLAKGPESGQGDIRQAVGCYQQALKCNPDFAEAHYNLGGLLYQMDAISDATAHLEEAVRLKPNYVMAHFFLAKCYKVAHQDAQALAAGRRALEAARAAKQARMAAEIDKWIKDMADK